MGAGRPDRAAVSSERSAVFPVYAGGRQGRASVLPEGSSVFLSRGRGRPGRASILPESAPVFTAVRKMTLRPTAGTRPRGATPEEDQALAVELLADPKERAEHVMLIDLARNDVGRVCEAGSVALTVEMEVERYSHVMHIVSEVSTP